MNIPINADAYCTDGICGRTICVIVNPITQQVTHLVVKEKKYPSAERLVPMDWIAKTTPDRIWLRCAQNELAAMESFTETEFVRIEPSENQARPFLMLPYVTSEATVIPVEHERIPPHELAVRRGARVEASDGRVGKVDEFLVDATDEHITHLVLRKGHLWGKKNVTIPISQIDRIEAKTIYLKIDKHGIESLPAIPVLRRYFWTHQTQPEPMSEGEAGPGMATVDCLIVALGSKDVVARVRARQSLVAMGENAVAPLIEALASSDPYVRWEAAKSLGQIGAPATFAAPALVKALRDKDFGVRWLAAEGLIAIGSAGLAPLLKALIEHSDSIWLREGAHHVFRRLTADNKNNIVAPVLETLDGWEPEIEVLPSAQTALNALMGAVDEQ